MAVSEAKIPCCSKLYAFDLDRLFQRFSLPGDDDGRRAHISAAVKWNVDAIAGAMPGAMEDYW